MDIQGLRLPSARQGYGQTRYKKDLRQRMAGRAHTSSGTCQEKKRIDSGSLHKAGKIPLILTRWWDLLFGSEDRKRMAIGKICMSLEILGTRPRMTKGGDASALWQGLLIRLRSNGCKVDSKQAPFQCHPCASGNPGKLIGKVEMVIG